MMVHDTTNEPSSGRIPTGSDRRSSIYRQRRATMNVSVEIAKQNVRRIILDGRLDAAGAQAAEADFNAAVAAAPNVIVDLGKVPFIASVGIRLLVLGTQTQAKLGGKMVLMNPDEVTRKILKTTGIDQLVPVRNGLDEALASFG